MPSRRRRAGDHGRGACRWPALSCLLATLLASCTPAPERVGETFFVFGSESRIDIVGLERERAQAALAEISALLRRLHVDWHSWEPGPLMELNTALARGERVRPPDTMLPLVERGLTLARKSGGLFDPSVGTLLDLWGFYTSDFPIRTPEPDLDAIARWRATDPSWDDLVFEDGWLQSRNPDLRLDFGAIAEGMAAHHVVEILLRHGATDALVALGGDVYALGQAGDRPWRVAIPDPYGGGTLALLDLHDREALFSSGSYNRYRESAVGIRLPHVVDPRTGLPVTGVAAVSVLHPDPVLADAVSTGLMVAGVAGFRGLLAQMGVRCALMLTEDNELLLTAAMQQRVRMQRDPIMLGRPTGTPGPCGEPEPPRAPPG